MKKKDMGKFVREHKWKIINGVVAVAAFGIGIGAGYEYCCKRNVVLESKLVSTLLLDCKEYYGNKPAVFAGVDTNGIALTDLGTLGERMISSGINPDANVATHFLVFGKGKNK